MMAMDEDEEFDGDVMDITDFSEAELETFQIPQPDAEPTTANKNSDDDGEDGDKKTGEVIALDAFRKK